MKDYSQGIKSSPGWAADFRNQVICQRCGHTYKWHRDGFIHRWRVKVHQWFTGCTCPGFEGPSGTEVT